ncbi:FG-GAP repeat domain-containing protein [Streptomyces sp. NPDC088090]|uniref:FG-GAP repeat domain-containing protein n=1 Tax=Streptomyces sp. NPDC088090 TaxID=3365822 RepID=UPI00384B1E4F
MNGRHSPRRLAALLLALSTATAVTGTLVTAVPAAGAAGAGAARPAAAEAAALPVGAQVVSAGATGYLTSREDAAGKTVLEWRTFADGSVTVLSGATAGYDSGSDHAVVSGPAGVTVRDMRPGATRSATYDLTAEFKPGARLIGAVGAHLFVTVPTPEGFSDLYELYEAPGGGVRKTKRSSRPRAIGFVVAASSGDRVLFLGTNQVTQNLSPRAYWQSVVTLGEDTAVDGEAARDLGDTGRWASPLRGALTADHRAWTWQEPAAAGITVASAEGERHVVFGSGLGAPYLAGIVGNTLAHSEVRTVEAPPDELFPLYGRDLDGDGGTSYKLLEDYTSVAHAPDGSLLVRGRSPEHDGLFRISAGAGRPVVSLVADTGRDVTMRIVASHVPAVVDMQARARPYRMDWVLNQAWAHVEVRLTHAATGATLRTYAARTGYESSAPYVLDWDGLVDGVPAPNGAYRWEVTARPFDGVAAPATASGSFTVRRDRNPHDFNDNGSTDLLARDASGVLWRDDLFDWPVDAHLAVARRTRVGAGWNTYERIEAVGNIAGAAHGDLVGVDGSGLLWHYLGKGDGTFTARRRVGGGWQVYDRLTGGSDLNGDGRPDLVASDGTGTLWFYRGTGDAARPFAARVRVGGGWQVYDRLTAVGNIAGTAAGDLVARDRSGVLWLYQGNGRGGFAGRVRVGGGWQVYAHLVGAGDLDNDGRPDLVAHGADGTVVYGTTGSATRPFTRLAAELYPDEGTAFDPVL